LKDEIAEERKARNKINAAKAGNKVAE